MQNTVFHRCPPKKKIINEITPQQAARYQQLKMPETVCHSTLDAESRVSFFWVPAFAGMTVFLCPDAEHRGII
jgi:hypothetical protein